MLCTCIFLFNPYSELCVSVLQRNRTTRICVYIWKFIGRNWLTQLWRPRNPTIHNLQTGGSGIIQSESEGLRARGADGVNPSPRTGENEVGYPSLDSEAGRKEVNSFLYLLFYSGPQRTG